MSTRYSPIFGLQEECAIYTRYKLNNGLRIIIENIPYVKSVSAGIWVGTGSRCESASNNGISHFIEHMLFKGTHKRTAKQIAEEMDFIGGQLNAFTGIECTCYYTKTLDAHIGIALDLLSDMFLHSRFDRKDVELERGVILEEIRMYEDSPEDVVHDLMTAGVWAGNPLAMPVSGSYESVEAITPEQMRDYMSRYYAPHNVTLAVAGSFNEGELINLITDKFGGDWGRGAYEAPVFKQPSFHSAVVSREKDIEQAHICIGFPGVSHESEKKYAMAVMSNVLGGGMSSRLFQNIREERGLAYSIYSYPDSYKDTGIFTIYAGTGMNNVQEVKELIYSEISNLLENGLPDIELNRGREQLKGSYILGLENISSRMSALGKSELLYSTVKTPDQIIASIDRVEHSTIMSLANAVFSQKCESVLLPFQ